MREILRPEIDVKESANFELGDGRSILRVDQGPSAYSREQNADTSAFCARTRDYDQYLREALICGSQAASLHVSNKLWV